MLSRDFDKARSKPKGLYVQEPLLRLFWSLERVYRGYIGGVEKKMEATISGLGLEPLYTAVLAKSPLSFFHPFSSPVPETVVSLQRGPQSRPQNAILLLLRYP